MLLKRYKELWVVKGGRSPLQERLRKELSQKLGLENGRMEPRRDGQRARRHGGGRQGSTSTDLQSQNLVYVTALPLTSYVALDKLMNPKVNYSNYPSVSIRIL